MAVGQCTAAVVVPHREARSLVDKQLAGIAPVDLALQAVEARRPFEARRPVDQALEEPVVELGMEFPAVGKGHSLNYCNSAM
jgi:hypothetical protein